MNAKIFFDTYNNEVAQSVNHMLDVADSYIEDIGIRIHKELIAKDEIRIYRQYEITFTNLDIAEYFEKIAHSIESKMQEIIYTQFELEQDYFYQSLELDKNGHQKRDFITPSIQERFADEVKSTMNSFEGEVLQWNM